MAFNVLSHRLAYEFGRRSFFTPHDRLEPLVILRPQKRLFLAWPAPYRVTGWEASLVAVAPTESQQRATVGAVLLRAVKKVEPYAFEERMVMQAELHDRLFARLGVTLKPL